MRELFSLHMHRRPIDLDSAFRSCGPDDEVLDLPVRLLQVIVHHNLVVGRLSAVRKVHLVLRLFQPLENRLFFVRRTVPQSLLQYLHGRRRKEQEAWARERGMVRDLLDALTTSKQ
jgi:hypothetical protein